jgi:dihydrofolate reductase
VRRVIHNAMVSLDGMFEGPGEGADRIDWFRADDEWEEYSVELLDAAGTLLFGWRGFEGMAAFWPTQTGEVADRMNGLEKIGFSRSERTTTWRNARVSGDAVGEVDRLKGTDGKPLVILGSADLAAALTAHRLIDEYRIAVNPVVLGAGVPLFPPGTKRLDLERTDIRLFDSGMVEIRLRPAGAA